MSECFPSNSGFRTITLALLILAISGCAVQGGAGAALPDLSDWETSTRVLADLGDCLDRLVECRVCLGLNAADALNRDCDDFDDGLTNGTCPP